MYFWNWFVIIVHEGTLFYDLWFGPILWFKNQFYYPRRGRFFCDMRYKNHVLYFEHNYMLVVIV